MSKTLKWTTSTLIIVLIGFAALQVYLHIDIKNFEEGLKEDRPDPKPRTLPNIVFDEEKPKDAPGFKWVWHGDHWCKVPITQADDTSVEENNPIQFSKPEQPQGSAAPQEDVYIDGQLMERAPHPPFETYAHLLKDPEAIIQKNAKIILENYGKPAAYRARTELNLLNLAIHKGYVGGSMWSDEARKLGRLKEEVLWKPLEERGLVQSFPVPILEPIPEGGKPE